MTFVRCPYEYCCTVLYCARMIQLNFMFSHIHKYFLYHLHAADHRFHDATQCGDVSLVVIRRVVRCRW